MNPKEKLIISKLLTLAEKQQKILTKMAQVVQDDSQANISYLKNAWTTAAVNTGFEGHTPEVTYTPGSAGSSPGVTLAEKYTLKGAVPNNFREKFDRQFKAQVAGQKPDLADKISIFYLDPNTQPA